MVAQLRWRASGSRPVVGSSRKTMFRPADHRQAEVDPALLTAGQGPDPGACLRGEIDHGQHLGDRPRCWVQAGEQSQQVLDRRLGVQARRLQDESDPGPPGPSASTGVGAQDADAPAGGFEEALHGLDQRRLARTVGTQHRHQLSLGDVEGDVVERGEIAVGLRQAFDLDGGHRGPPVPEPDRPPSAPASPITTATAPTTVNMRLSVTSPAVTRPAPISTPTTGWSRNPSSRNIFGVLSRSSWRCRLERRRCRSCCWHWCSAARPSLPPYDRSTHRRGDRTRRE